MNESDEIQRLRQRVAELEARESRESHERPAPNDRDARLAEAERAAQMGTWEWDVTTGTVSWSAELYRILGYEPDVDRPSAELYFQALHPEDRERARAEAEENAREGRERSSRLRVVRKAGEVREVVTAGTASRDAQGNIIRLYGTVLDLTDRAHLEARLRQAEKMEALGRLAGGVAHDINNVLTVILGFAGIVARQTKSPDVQEIIRAAETASDLTRQLLAFSRQVQIKSTVVDLNELLRASSKMLARAVGEDVRIATDIAPEPFPVRMEGTQITQLLLNLVINARDAMPRGGTVRIRSMLDLATAYAARGGRRWIRLEVEDEGVGMDVATIARIFDPFFTTKPHGQGTGLGLSTVFGIVQRAGGRIDVSSSPGRGARFEIRLPIETVVDVHAEAPASVPTPVTPATPILLIEDDPGVARVVAETLTGAGYLVHTAGCGDEAEELWLQHRDDIALLVSDVVMPGRSGPDLAHQFRVDRPDLPVLFVTGHAPDWVSERGVEITDPILEKPFSAAQLLDAVSLHAARRVRVVS